MSEYAFHHNQAQGSSCTFYPDIETISIKTHTLLRAQFEDQDIVSEQYEVIWKSFPFFMASRTQMLAFCITTMMQRIKSADTA